MTSNIDIANRALTKIGAKTGHKGSRWISNIPNNHWGPGVFGWTAQP